MGKNYDYSYEWDIKYCYPNSFILRNKFNITNSEEFNIADIEMIEASIDSFNCDYAKMTKIFRKITKLITKKEQEDFIKRIATKNSPAIKVYDSMIG